MDNTTQNIPVPIKQLGSYSILVIFITLFILLCVFLYILNPLSFNKIFGKEIFITGGMLLLFGLLFRDIIALKNKPDSSFLSSLEISKETWFLPSIIILIVIIGIGSIYAMLNVAGVFDNPPPENNISIIINFILIALFIAFSTSIYFNSKEKDNVKLSNYPKIIQDMFNSRTNYTILFFVFILSVIIFYFVNPYGIVSKYGTLTIFFIIFIGLIMFGMITIYQYGLANPNKILELPNPVQIMLKGLYIIFALFISGALIYYLLNFMGIFNQDASEKETWGKLIFNIIIFSTMLGIIYKLINAGGFLEKNPVFRLILNTILYIPCLLFVILNSIINFGKTQTANAPPTKNEFIVLIISLLLIFSYFAITYYIKPYLLNKYLKQGGKQIINQPININKASNIATYQRLNDGDTFDYQYALSFWFYLDSFSLSTNSSYTKEANILSYGENPVIKYNAEKNTLYITVKNSDNNNSDNVDNNDSNLTSDKIKQWNEEKQNITDPIEQVKIVPLKEETDNNGNRLIYQHNNVKLQKWNHIVINYSGGTLDIFYNGRLVKSAINVVPYMKYDMLTSGMDKGIFGNIANVMYFKTPLDILTIDTLYTSLKKSNPPCINENKEKIINLDI